MKQYDRSILRLADANLNRAIEGIRVLEESARMLFNDSSITYELKTLRHSLMNLFLVHEDFRNALIISRDSEHDVLRNGETESESKRMGLSDIIRSNSSRAREALRNLEEYGKLLGGDISGKCKNFRFILYDIEKRLICRLTRDEKKASERLRFMVIIDPPENGDVGSMALTSTNAGAGIIVCRDSNYTGKKRLLNLESIMKSVQSEKVTVLGWDRADISLAGGADGVLIGQNGPGIESVRLITPPSWIVAGIIERCEELDLRFTVDNGADFMLIDYDDISHRYLPDLDAIKEYIESVPAPVIVKIPPEEEIIADMFDMGAAGIAISFIADPEVMEKMRILADKLSMEHD